MTHPDAQLSGNTISVTRVFRAPRAFVYAAWTDATHLAQWFGPEVASIPECVANARVGGRWRVVMRMPDGIDYPIDGTFVELVPHEKIVFTMNTDRHPDAWHKMIDDARPVPTGAKGSPITTTVLLTERDGFTTMKVMQAFDVETDAGVHYSMGARDGWGQSFDKLERLLLPDSKR